MECKYRLQRAQHQGTAPEPIVIRRKIMPTPTNAIFWIDRWIVSTKHYWRVQALNSDRRVMIRKATSKTIKVGHELKRLQRRKMWKAPEKRHERRIETANRFHMKEERRGMRLRRTRRRLQTPTCTLWNCKRRRGIRTEKHCEKMGDFTRRRAKRCASRISVLSDLSARSRTPILTLRSSPLFNDCGFQTEYNV